VLGLSFFSYFVYGYVQNATELIATAKYLSANIVQTFVNPLAYARVTLIVPLYASLTTRIVKRFAIKHGFKIVFMLGFLCYTWNVWSESLSDDPFTIVGVSSSASNKEIRRACRQGSLKLHPDKHPGQEDAIRPMFEKHTRACKVLNDEKLKARYLKLGALPKDDQGTGGEEAGPETGPSMLSVGGGSYIVSFCFYCLLFVGAPSYAVYMFADMFYDNEARLAKIAADAKSLNADMIKLYTYGHLSLGLDIAELYISAAKDEFKDLYKLACVANARGATPLNSLAGKHAERFNLWLESIKIKDTDKAAYEAKCKKVDDAIVTATASIDKVVQIGKGSSKTK